MALRTVITERQRRYGAELRAMREAAGLSVREAAVVVDMGQPQLSHIEAGRTSLSPDRARDLLKHYGCTDETLIGALIDLGSQSGKGWWSAFRATMPQHALDLAELESSARSILSYETFYIPGLLQTPEYTRAIYEYRYGRVGDPAAAMAFRHERQRILSEEGGPECHFIIHEAALHMRFAGIEGMRGQLVRLLELAGQPNITIQVAPFAIEDASPYASLFFIAAPSAPQLATVGIDHPKRSEYLSTADEIGNYRATFDHLADISLRPVKMSTNPQGHAKRDSWGMVHHIMYQL
ncbi:helix-turn-helix domain-containing protein [Kitasatospora mediocidica]|uniref:helix-turn-helix domain-containing protein n=1 Tax=Kitasatospora mediocidica TaxID=58352 RepID=UPI0018DE98EF|nr:helix-turn-helix transcriptional regulator [Kitasatospora mediocidica]